MRGSQLQNIDPYDWFCGPGSHIVLNSLHSSSSFITWDFDQIYSILIFVRRGGGGGGGGTVLDIFKKYLKVTTNNM